MMKITSILMFIFLIQVSAQANRIDLDELRDNYKIAVTDKKLCLQMIEILKSQDNDPIFLAYLGGFQTIWANHTFNPIEKLRTFNKGKKNIQKAILKDPDNVEARFIRFSVQKNAPFFLGYNLNIKEDEEFLKIHRTKISSDAVIKNIETLLKD
ncbi:hypothetical protein [Pedobacter sp.]|uniref:hypothetical protein n=1 Tax=Pedobacter sp. TaxID=1411316 RepID=UPI00396C50FB